MLDTLNYGKIKVHDIQHTWGPLGIVTRSDRLIHYGLDIINLNDCPSHPAREQIEKLKKKR